MHIELSDQSAKDIQAAIGTTDPVVVTRIFELIASDKQLVQSFLLPEQTNEELQESLAMCDRGMQDIAEGKTKPAKETLRDIAAKHGLKI
ncbi:MAG: hypothetical protein WD049_03495, partial [Candidatus Paceibacterota bacterium]